MSKYIYVILSRTMTIPGRAIRKATGDVYSHASICLDKNLNEIYSFARFHYQTPLIGGFVQENVESLCLGKNKDVAVKIFKIPVTTKQYRHIINRIEYFKKHEQRYMYNLFALIFFPMGIQFSIRDSYICTEFVSQLLKECGIEKSKWKGRRLTPASLVSALRKYVYYDGSLQEYIQTVEHEEFDNHFMERENTIFVIGKSIKQIGKLLYRKIT